MATDAVRARFVRALYELAVGGGVLQERLGAAWTELLPLRREDLPEGSREAYAVIEAELLAAPDDPAALSDEVAAAAAERVFRLAIELLGG